MLVLMKYKLESDNVDDELQKGGDNLDDEVQKGSDVDDKVQVRSDNVDVEVQVGSDDKNEYGDDVANYVGSDVGINNLSDSEYECIEDYVELDWATILLYSEKVNHFYDKKECDDDDVYDSDQLHIPRDNGYNENHKKFPAYKSGEGFKFHLWISLYNIGVVHTSRHILNVTYM